MIRIFEVGPRDGLQNESRVLSISERLELIGRLLKSGLRDIEVGAFVRPDRIPQMAGTDELYRSELFHQLSHDYPDARFWSLVPNEKGLERAMECGARHIAVFGGATETFVRKNIGMSIDQSLDVFNAVVKSALAQHLQVRGYISVCWVCPYEGEVSPEAVVHVAKRMLEMGVPKISLGDTVGRAHPVSTETLLTRLFEIAPPEAFAVHFHDTYGMAIANIDRSIRIGITEIDSSIGGLGGCPYAAGATGNVATEDVFTLLEGYAVRGKAVESLRPTELLQAAAYIQERIGRTLPSKRLAAFQTQTL